MDYLGATLAGDGKHGNELSQRIGAAKAVFEALAKVWRHSSLTWKGKLRVYASCVESKLLYSLSSVCLNIAQLRQLNGFQNRCLQKLIGVKAAYYSRVSNATVLTRTGHPLASTSLLKRQLQLFGKVLRCPEAHPLRQISFIPGTDYPLTDRYVRRRGRPAKEWIPEMIKNASALFGNLDSAKQANLNKHLWNRKLKSLLC